MGADALEGLLVDADSSAPKAALSAPRLTDLESRRRRQVARRGIVLILVAGLCASVWSSTLRDRRRAELVSTAEHLGRSLAELGSTLASLQESRAPIPSAASEDAAMSTFRALHPGADRGDAQAIDGMRWLAQSFSTTQGGRCAQLFLSSADRPSTHPSGPSAPQPGPLAPSDPTKR